MKHIMNRLTFHLKTYYQSILLITSIIFLISIIYGNDLKILFNEATQTEVFSHILLTPLFAGFLFYLKRDMIKASLTLEKHQRKTKTKYLNEVIGVILCLIAFLVYWYGSHTFYPLEYHILSIPIFLTGLILTLSNLKVLTVLIFPIVFLLFLVPPPLEFIYTTGGLMANFETQIAYALLSSIGLPVTLSSSYGPPIIELTITSGKIPFTVDLSCSGVYTLIAFAMFSFFLAITSKASILKKLLMSITGFLIFEALNIIRITTIILIAYSLGEQIAMFIFHSIAGLLLIFIGMLLTLITAEKILKIQTFPKSQKDDSCPKCKKGLKNNENFCLNCGKYLNPPRLKVSQKTWAKIFLLIIGSWLVTISLNAPTFAIAQGPIEISSSTSWENATNVIPKLPDYRLKFLYRDISYERIARQDAALIYAYFPKNPLNSTVYVSINVANSLSNLHNWEVCLITWQTAQGRYPLVSVLESKEMQLLENVPIIARYLAFKHPENYTQITLYWFETAIFDTGITVEQKYVRISLIIFAREQTNYEHFENELLSIGKKIASYWQPIKLQTLISLGILAIQLLLIICIAFLIITIITQQLYESRKKARNLKLFRSFASKEDKLLLTILIDLTKRKRNIKTKDILNAFKKRIRKPLKLNDLIEKLAHLEEYGFIKRDVILIKNNPQLVWKTSVLSI